MKNIKLVTDDLTPALDDINRKQLVRNFKIIEENFNDLLNQNQGEYISKKEVYDLFSELIGVLKGYDMPLGWDGSHVIDAEEE